jgi:hypothetical protein
VAPVSAWAVTGKQLQQRSEQLVGLAVVQACRALDQPSVIKSLVLARLHIEIHVLLRFTRHLQA